MATEAQKRANKKYYEKHEFIKVCFRKGMGSYIRELLPYVRDYYGLEENEMKSIQDFIRFCIEGEIWEMIQTYGETEVLENGSKVVWFDPKKN